VFKPNPDALVNRINFKVSPVVEAAIEDGAAELGVTVSEFLRLCIYIGDPFLRSKPALKNMNRQELRELMEYIGNTLAIHPVSFSLRQEDEE